MSFWLLLIGLSAVSAQESKLPKDAMAVLQQFPQKAITLDVMLARAIQSSDSYKQVASQFPMIEVSELNANAVYDPRMFLKYDWNDDRTEPTNVFMPSNFKSSTYGLGVSTALPTGTAISTEVVTAANSFDIGAGSVGHYQSSLRLSLTQNLWQDSFGQATRNNAKAGKLQRDAALAQFHDSIQGWATGTMGVFYDAWLAKMRVMAMEENTKRRSRLENIMRVKTRRGTAEEPDLLQVRSALMVSQTQEAEALQVLIERWQSLVINLKLPNHWLNIDPRLIPILLDDPISEAQKICQQPPTSFTEDNATAQVKRAINEAKAADFKLRAAKSLARPDLEVRASAMSNGVDTTSRRPTLDDSRDFSNPGYGIGIQLTMPFFSRAEEAGYRVALAEKSRAEAAADTAMDQWRMDWLSSCANLKRMSETVAKLGSALKDQDRRVVLDERRFSIGRTAIFTAIQAGDDATMADLSLRSAEVQLRSIAWKVHRLHDGLETYFKRLEKIKLKGI